MSSTSGQVVPHPMVSAYGTEEWANLSEEERQLSQRKMEVGPATPPSTLFRFSRTCLIYNIMVCG